MEKIDLVITACDRNDLLQKTLESFVKFNSYPINKLYIRDDCGLEEVYQEMILLLDFLELPFPFEVLPIGQIGQAKSLDLLMKKTTSPYIFHSEEDWEYYKEGFMEKALSILKYDQKISSVWIRDKNDGISALVGEERIIPEENLHYNLVKRSKFSNGWSFNPHLKRKKDYKKSYEEIKKTSDSIYGESTIGLYYKELGFETAWLTEGYAKHIGGQKSTYRPKTPYRENAEKI